MKVCIDTPLTLIAMALAIFTSITLSSRHAMEHGHNEIFKQTKAALSYNDSHTVSGYNSGRNDSSDKSYQSNRESLSDKDYRPGRASRLGSTQTTSDLESLRFSNIGNYNLSVSQQRLLELWGLTE
ncbi:hypothetical protein BTA51_13680 [Hahella sp. CCB-MM4]|uniref:hypothetical protein n=1 Tax=Hahella sp. (strain CCB-MM4) TaxID=1926491 RepID=UPI000B9ACE43|nr:hypothetical protein [Hahella sp. CCB-MM4]OZG73000.1 hypothetical protein BTA51_13680 [Hahella sp. CCB-MM4]